MQPSPAAVVQAQLDAYNARDIRAFAACYAPSARIHDLVGGTLRAEGGDALQTLYGDQFIRWPDQRATVVSRQIAGELVIDTEFVTGVPDRASAHVVVIYHVRAGLIVTAWLTPRFAGTVPV